MSLDWIHEDNPQWDTDKATIVGGTPSGVFNLKPHEPGQLVPGDWWRVERDGQTVGYGWMDCVWGDAEVLLAVRPDSRGHGVGTFIVDHLEKEAASRGLNYMYNVVLETHPEREATTQWLTKRGFAPSHDSERLQRRVP